MLSECVVAYYYYYQMVSNTIPFHILCAIDLYLHFVYVRRVKREPSKSVEWKCSKLHMLSYRSSCLAIYLALYLVHQLNMVFASIA